LLVRRERLVAMSRALRHRMRHVSLDIYETHTASH
jgi:hypothetical protein